jgi:V8-like Glu-specific endopeptidase
MEKLGFYLAIFLLAANFSCSDNSTSSAKIYGGNRTIDWQTVAAISSNNKFICTATALTNRILVTAAHCIVDQTNLKITLGDSIESADVYDIESATPSPVYKSSKADWNDVGYIKTKEPMNFKTEILPVISTKNNDDEIITIGNSFSIVGFGQTESGEIGKKYEAKVKLTKVETNEIELGGEGMDACLGDSGGPAFFNNFIVAVVSRGKKCGKGGRYGRISQHACWIQNDSKVELNLPEEFCTKI